MNVLLDACVPRPLRRFLLGHVVRTAQEMGWSQLKNGALLREAESEFDVFISADQNLKYQQDLLGRRLAILILPTNGWPTIRANAESIAEEVSRLKPGAFIELVWD